MPTITSLEKDIKTMQERNARVEADKAWETSAARKVLITLITYLFALAVMAAIGVAEPYYGALIPTLGFYLSTLTLGIGKRFWINRFYKG